MEFRKIVDFAKEKAPAIALALVVSLGSVAIIGEGDGQSPGQVGNGNPPDNGEGGGNNPGIGP